MFDDSHDAHGEESPKLPPWATEEQVNALLKDIAERLERIGVYTEDMFLGLGGPENDLMVSGMFRIGQIAFTKRVQDPEGDKSDDVIRRFENDATTDRVQEIKDKFRRENPPDEDPQP